MNKLKVDAIKNGTVIDHIPGKTALRVFFIIGEVEDEVVSIGLNLPSQTTGKKDLVKIEGRELSANEVNQIALIAPNATINIIRDFKVIKKFNVDIPEKIEGLMTCPNPKCITNMEAIPTSFKVKKAGQIQLQCTYCERTYPADEIKNKR